MDSLKELSNKGNKIKFIKKLKYKILLVLNIINFYKIIVKS
jgi:hypothetical protein